MRAGAVGVGDRAADREHARRCWRAARPSALAASFKYSDGAIVIALVAAAFLSPALSFKQALKGLALAGLIALAVVIVTNPYLFADWGTFTHDLDRQRKFAVRRRRCSASPSATAGSTT